MPLSYEFNIGRVKFIRKWQWRCKFDISDITVNCLNLIFLMPNSLNSLNLVSKISKFNEFNIRDIKFKKLNIFDAEFVKNKV